MFILMPKSVNPCIWGDLQKVHGKWVLWEKTMHGFHSSLEPRLNLSRECIFRELLKYPGITVPEVWLGSLDFQEEHRRKHVTVDSYKQQSGWWLSWWLHLPSRFSEAQHLSSLDFPQGLTDTWRGKSGYKKPRVIELELVSRDFWKKALPMWLGLTRKPDLAWVKYPAGGPASKRQHHYSPGRQEQKERCSHIAKASVV